MSDLDDFVTQTVDRHSTAATGVRNGDPTPFIEQLSTRDPVTLFPASQPSQIGWADVGQAIRRVASVYSASSPIGFDLIAAGVSDELAYLVGYERAASSIEGGADEELSLRVTQVYRREDGDWKLVHRHADPGPANSAAADHLRRSMRAHDAEHQDPA